MKKASFLWKYFVATFFNKRTGLISLSLLCYVLFQNSINDLSNTLFVDPVLAKVLENKTNDILMLLLNVAIAAFYAFWVIKNYKQSSKVNTIITLSGLIYIFNVYFDDTWNFTSYSENTGSNYMNIILFLFICNSLLLVRNSVTHVYYGFKSLNTPKENKSSFLIDEAWQEGEEDLSDIKPFAQKLAAEIKNIYVNKSFAIGVIGKWGTGKTSFLNMVKAHFQGNKDIIVIEFNPWKSSSPELIINDFFNTVKTELAKYSAEVSTELEEYAQKLAEIDSSGFVNLYNKILSKDESLEIQFTRINEIIKGFNKKVVIIIDDLDRLDKKEIIEVIRLVRNTANFYNTIFVVAYDKDYVVNAVRQINEHDSYSFLEKIFQMEYSLPLPMEVTIREQLIKILVGKLPNSEKAIRQMVNHKSDPLSAFYYMGSSAFDREYVNTDFVPQYIGTLRDVSRLCNSLIHNFKDLEGEISFRDYFLLELIKLKNQNLYNAIQAGSYLKTDYKEKNNVTASVYVFQKEDFAKEYKSEFPISVLSDTLQTLFPDKPKHDDRSVAVPSSFTMYFANRLFDNISLTRFRKDRRNGADSMKSFVDEIATNKSKRQEFLDVIGEIDSYDDKKDFETIVSTLFYLAQKDIGYNYYHLVSKIHSEAVKPVIEKYYNNEPEGYKTFIKSLLNSSKLLVSSTVMTNVIREYIYKKDNFSFILSLKECQDITVENLNKYIDGENEITLNSFPYYYSCVERIEDVTTKVILMEAANVAFKNFIEAKDPIGYLKIQIRDYGTPNIDKLFVMEPFIEQTFNGYGNFETFLSQQDQENAIVKQISAFYNAFKANGYNPIHWERTVGSTN